MSDKSLFNKMAPVGEQIEGQQLSTVPENLPQIGAKAGYKTSQGQLTIVFGLVAIILSALGYSQWTPERIENTYEMISQFTKTLGPILAFVPVLINYINSRGKIQSNELWASASLITGIGQEGQPLVARGLGIAEQILPSIPNYGPAFGVATGVRDEIKERLVVDKEFNILGIIQDGTFVAKEEVPEIIRDILGRKT